MTASPHSRSSELLARPAESAVREMPFAAAAQADQRRHAWRIWIALLVIISALYLLLWNPYWVPGGDSELYIAAARSLALGQGYRFNGQSISISPPGWQWTT